MGTRARGAAMGLIILALLPAGAARATLPRDAEEFAARMKREAVTPDGAAKLWFEAIFVYAKEATRDGGRRMLSQIMLDTKWEQNAYFVDRMKNKRYVFASYARGATPENHYQMDPDDFALVIVGSEKDRFRDQAWRVDLKSSGADAKRPLVLDKGDDGLWRVHVYSDIYADVKAP
jgi:hypothetical protein